MGESNDTVLKKAGLLRTHPDFTYRIARRMRIVQHQTGLTEAWSPFWEQYKMWQSISAHQYVYFLKVRQIGASTGIMLDNVLWVAANDADGEEVKLGCFIDTDDKAQEQKRRALGMCQQLGLKVKPSGNTIIFPNGSMMHFASAGGRRAAASVTFQRLHLTEVPFWRDATNSYNSIMQSLVLDGQCIIETTMGLDDPIGVELWKTENNYHKVFFPFEEHEEYRADDFDDPKFAMSEDEAKWLRSEGFTREDSMRYWLYLLRNKSANDIHKNFREYPQKPEHSFMFAEGRWCNVTPEVLRPLRSVTLPRVPGAIHIYREPSDASHHCVVGTDTGGGLDLDNTAVTVVDGKDGFICATYYNNQCKTDDQAAVCKYVQDLYTFHQRQQDGSVVHRVPKIRAESNGVGLGLVHQLYRLRCVVEEFATTKDLKQRFMEITARKVEAGEAYGPADLAYESQVIRTKAGQFLGAKDLFMTLGFCYDWLERFPYKPLKPTNDPGTFNVRDRLKPRKRR